MNRQQFLVFALTVLVSFWGLKACQVPTGGQRDDRLGHSSVAALLLPDSAHAGTAGANAGFKPGNPCPANSKITRIGEQVTLTGTVRENHRLIDDQGRTFEMLDTGEGFRVKSLVGRKVEIEAVVMELDRQEPVVEVHEYEVLE